MWATGTGSDVMKRIAAPMVGGIFTSFVLELLVYPAIYEVWRGNTVVKKLQPLLTECPNKPPAALRLIPSTPAEDATGD